MTCLQPYSKPSEFYSQMLLGMSIASAPMRELVAMVSFVGIPSSVSEDRVPLSRKSFMGYSCHPISSRFLSIICILLPPALSLLKLPSFLA